MERAYYSDTIQGFLADPADTILGKLVSHSEFSVDLSQRDAWRTQIIQLQSVLKHQRGAIHFEYAIPRMGKRVDVVLEDASTEFEIQGLELDWGCVVWDADFRYSTSGWTHHAFRANRWERISKPARRTYHKNAYRVLLTRARQGMVIVVPTGDVEDPTRNPAFYDPTFEYLKGIGLETLV